MRVIDDTCSGCGERNPAGSQFCLFCGIFLGWENRPVDPGRATSASSSRTESHLAPVDSVSGAPPFSDPVPTEELAVLPSTRTLPAVGAGDPPEAVGVACPSCQTPNDGSRRFCGRCGWALHPAPPVRPVASRRPSWWHRLWLRVGNPDERSARRAYRRSLPGLYRWRRLLLTLLAVVVVASGLTLVGRDPVRLAVAAWHDLRGDVVQIDGVAATAVLPEGVTENAPAAFAVDHDTATAWSTTWTATGTPVTPPACGTARASGGLVLTLPDTRVRQMRIVSGVTDPSQRTLELLPKTLHVTGSDGTCLTVELTRSGTVQTVLFDTDVSVSSLTLTVASTYAPVDASRTIQQVSITEVSLWARPQ